jgi:hypothetical protein
MISSQMGPNRMSSLSQCTVDTPCDRPRVPRGRIVLSFITLMSNLMFNITKSKLCCPPDYFLTTLQSFNPTRKYDHLKLS